MLDLVSLVSVSKQICELSNNKINGKVCSPKELYSYLRWVFLISDSAVVDLDYKGEQWLCEISHNDEGEVYFFIPNTREQEDIVFRRTVDILKNVLEIGEDELLPEDADQ